MRWRIFTGGLLAGLALVPATAHSAVETRVRATGALTVSWQGDPARGCAEAGVCDLAGSFTTRADPEQGSSVSSGPSESHIDVSFEPPTVRVLRGPATDPLGACTDGVGGHAIQLRRSRGRVRLAPEMFGYDEALGSGRCAGPLPDDVAAALPSARLPPRALRTGRLLDFRARRPLAAGPFSGEVRSTLRVRVRQRRVADGEEGDGEWATERLGPSERIRWVRRTRLELEFRVAEVAGSLTTAFRGADPGCLAFDACDLDGRIELRPRLGEEPTTLEVVATGPLVARRGQADRALAALRDGRLRLDYASAEESLPAALSADVGRLDGPRCRDGRDVALPALTVEETPAGTQLQVGSESYGDSEDVLRTRCPGPTRTDVTGDDDVLATAPFPPAELASERPRMRLTTAPETAPGPFAFTAADGVEVVLERTAARVSVSREPSE